MKKLFAVVALVCFAVAATAQQALPTEKHSVSTNSFWSNWFIQAHATWDANYIGGQGDILSAPFKGFVGGDRYTTPAASLAIGKWFTPGLGLRTKAHGIWTAKEGTQKYWTANEQVLVNLSNLFCGYSNTRVWSFIPYVGAGVARNMTASQYGTDFGAGILNEFRLCSRLAIDLELAYTNFSKDFFAGQTALANGLANKQRDHQFSLEIGLTYRLGKASFSKMPDIEAIRALSQGQIDALSAQLSDAQAENARLQNLLANQPKPTAQPTAAPKEKLVSAPVSVFFDLGKADIASRKDMQSVIELAELAKKHHVRLVVTGYADSQTGDPAQNKELSQRRADAIADELVKLGVSPDLIQTIAAGGVDMLTPAVYNRRATVEIK